MGRNPYYHAPHLFAAGLAIFAMAVQAGTRPEFPAGFPLPGVRDVIQTCWHADPKQRPSIKELMASFAAATLP